LVDALDLGSSFERSEGSSPFTRTKKLTITNRYHWLCECLHGPFIIRTVTHED
jgi:hypothetical protein